MGADVQSVKPSMMGRGCGYHPRLFKFHMTRTEHLLVILAEECGEVAQRAAKALRFSLEQIEPGQTLTNADRISREIADLWAVIEMLDDTGALRMPVNSRELVAKKRARIEEYFKLSRELGTLEDD